jgi:5-methyltetrahydropteroyltriglutamate--homocysteine methyltransferase
MFPTSLAGSLPKPAWLAATNKLWPQWRAEGSELAQAKLDATLLWIKAQEDAGLDIVGDGEQSRQHFVHGFLEQVEGIDFAHRVKMGIRNTRYDATVPQVVAPLRLKGRVHEAEARFARAHTARKLKFTLPGPMTIVDTIGRALQFVPKHRFLACTNCGMAPMSRPVAEAKLRALALGTAIARERHR